MRQARLVTYWLLLLIPTLIIGAAAFSLLRHEQDRINAARRASVRRHAAAVATDLDLSVTEVQEGLMQHLLSLPEPGLAGALRQWQAHNPLVRNVFIATGEHELVVPSPEAPASAEEAGFMQRYSALFSGRVPWEQSQSEARTAVADSGPQQSQSPRQQLWRLANTIYPQQAASQSQDEDVSPRRWMTWFSDNQLCLLGWAQVLPSGQIRGVEIEMMALLSRLVLALPAEPPTPGAAYAILDSSGRLVHQSGTLAVEPDATPLVSVPVGTTLPHWRIAVYSAPGGHGPTESRAFLAVTGLLAGILVVAILAGGGLLLWQARRSYLDAARKTSFVANVSHELKTPLTSIRMYAELLQEGRARDESKRQRYLDVIVSESQRLTRLVNNVLDFSRLEQGRKTYRLDELDLGATAQTVLDNQRERVRQAGMELHLELPTEPVHLAMDRDALEQILLNLVDNAVKYAAEGGEVGVSIVADVDAVRLSVLDRGAGIPAAERERIFGKFHRVDDSLTSGKPGCGLGLTIARKMLRDLGGDIVCVPREGGGACFAVTLLRSPASEAGADG